MQNLGFKDFKLIKIEKRLDYDIFFSKKNMKIILSFIYLTLSNIVNGIESLF